MAIDVIAEALWPFTIHHSPFTIHHSPFTIHHSPFTIHCSPFTIHHAVNLHNISICQGQTISPYTFFTGEESPWSPQDFNCFGCPAYVLQEKLHQDENSLKKWKECMWHGVYTNFSSHHAKSIAVIIYNPTTTHATPQFHSIFDEGFMSVSYGSDINNTTT